MIADIRTVMWKEWRELLAQRFGTWGSRLSFLLIIGVLGVFLPLRLGEAWTTSPLLWAFSAWTAFTLTVSVVADAFAGERERHTLETLLATRLSDTSIFAGKVGATIGYSNSFILLLLGVTWLTVNLIHWSGTFWLYDAVIGLGAIVFGILGAGLAASTGVLISMRAPTVRQAQQTLSLIAMGLPFVLVYGSQLLPVEWTTGLLQIVNQGNTLQLGLWAGAGLLLVNVAIITWAVSHFKRSRLILKQ